MIHTLQHNPSHAPEHFQASYGKFSGEVWTTHSEISGHTFGIIFGADFSSDDKMSVDLWTAGFEHHENV